MQSSHFPKRLPLNHRRVVHLERLFPPEKVYQQRTDGMTERVKLEQANRNTLRDCKDMLEQLPDALRGLQTPTFTYGALYIVQ